MESNVMEFPQAQGDAQLLVPAERAVKAGGKELMITPMRAVQIARALRYTKTLLGVALLLSEMDGLEGEAKNNQFFRGLATLMDGGEDLLDLIAIAIKEPRAFVDNFEADELFDVARAAIEVNYDFFDRKLRPLLKDLNLFKPAAPAAEPDGDGQTPSTTSSPADTDSRT